MKILEPNFKQELWDSDSLSLSVALNWYNVNAKDESIWKWAHDWCKANGLKVNLRGRKVGEVRTFAALARMVTSRGLECTEQLKKRINDGFLSLHVVRQQATNESKPAGPTKAERESVEMLGQFDEWIDDLATGKADPRKPPSIFTTVSLASQLDAHVKAMLERLEDEKQYYHQTVYRALKLGMASILKAIDSSKEKLKTEKTKKRIKNTPPAVIAKKVRYQRELVNFRSIEPMRMVGARKAYAYDSGRRTLLMFISTAEGFTWSGTTLKNIDTGKSKCKTLRKPDQLLASTQFTMSNLNKLFGTVKAVEREPSPRFNDNITILCIA